MEAEEHKTLDDLIHYIQDEMSKITPDAGEDYTGRLSNLERLYALKGKNRPSRISRDALFAGFVQFASIAVIVGYERSHVAMSKGFSLLKRPD